MAKNKKFRPHVKEIVLNQEDGFHYDDSLMECLKNGVAVEINCELKASLGDIIDRSGFLDSEDDDTDNNAYGIHVDTIEYLENLDKYEKKKVLAKSKNILETQYDLVKGLDQEIIDLYAEQLVDLEDFPNVNLYSRDTSVTLQVQRLSQKGYWYNIGEKLMVDIEDLFSINQSTFSSNMIRGKTALECLMEQHEVEKEFLYSKVVNGKVEYHCIDQRVVIKSPMLKAGVEVDGQRLHSTVAPFWYSYDKDTKTVVQKPTFFMDQNHEEFHWFNEDGVMKTLFVIVPTMDDESNGSAARLEFNNEIQYGKNIANTAMMSDEMTDAIIAASKREEVIIESEGRKARRNALTNNDIKAIKDESIIASAIGILAKSLIEEAIEAKTPRQKVNVLNKINSNADKAEEILNAVRILKKVQGIELPYTCWQTLNKIAKQNKENKFSELVSGLEHAVENIKNLNNGTLSLESLDDEDIIDIREASLKHGRVNGKKTDCWINNPEISNAIKFRYAKIKGITV